MLTLGIDDAGRGPVIGPMVLAGVLIDDKIAEEFIKMGIKDSKMLTPKRRAMLVEKIKDMAETFEITITFPQEIDSSINSGVNLNSVEAIKSAEIINKINKGMNKIKVIIDCPSPNLVKWREEVRMKISDLSNLEVSCEHKADQNHVAVSAASILAKITRDAEIEKLIEKIGIDLGSGYASDDKTIKFIEKYLERFENQGLFRHSWETMRIIKEKKAQKKLF